MEPIMWIVIIIIGIGAIVVGVAGLAALYFAWWIIIPVLGACVGGVFGLLFGLGLVVIIGFFVLVFKK